MKRKAREGGKERNFKFCACPQQNKRRKSEEIEEQRRDNPQSEEEQFEQNSNSAPAQEDQIGVDFGGEEVAREKRRTTH